MEKQYRLGHEQLFLADPWLKLKNEVLAGLSVGIKYKLFDLKTNLEIPFTHEKEYYNHDFVNCSFNKNYEGYIKLDEISKEELAQFGYRLEYEIEKYFKEVFCDSSSSKPVNITKEEFYKILTENLSYFDNECNTKGTQFCSTVLYPIENGKEK